MAEIKAFKQSPLPAPTRSDLVSRAYGDIHRLMTAARQAKAEGLVEMQDVLAQCDATLARRDELKRELEALARPSTRAEIATILAALLENYPMNKHRASAATTRIMAERIGAAQPSVGALEVGINKIIDNPDIEFFPVTGVVLQAIAEASRSLGMTGEYLDKVLPRLREELQVAIKTQMANEAAYARRRQLPDGQ
ncbi:hypothetical protein [Afipia felis]|uniref:Uncharacterized protein n=2 Tax=Afipia felis TaxID=1035 RepID=A0A380W8P1_AFIFE|nr:hypothetical protein [Afipia felis]EKS28233.1 hypothetical protein HMPREF9697_00761 [Afipia felis ATCC 53690]SUU76943.1 Uncharacterised protein [Afipia felis]SUU85009.1 Uncharacterised protein [Afipia felis]